MIPLGLVRGGLVFTGDWPGGEFLCSPFILLSLPVKPLLLDDRVRGGGNICVSCAFWCAVGAELDLGLSRSCEKSSGPVRPGAEPVVRGYV